MSRSTRPPARQLPHRRLVQAAVWALFALLLATGSVLTARASHMPQPVVAAVATHQVRADDTATAVAANLDDPSLCSYKINPCEPATMNADNPLHLLPAWRWNGAVGLGIHKMSFMEIISGGGFLMAMGALFFTLAGFAWMLLLNLMQYAFSVSIVANAGHEINKTAGDLGRNIIESPIIWLVLAAGVIAVIHAGIKGNLPRALGLILAFALPVGGLQMMASAAASDNKQGSQVQGLSDVPAGSPAWLALSGNKLIDKISEGLTTGFGSVNSLKGSSSINTYSKTPAAPGCDSYRADLYATFMAAEDQDKGTTKDSAPALMTVSYLWDRAFLDQWTVTQLGNLTDGARVACHRLEQRANIAPKEQLAVVSNDPNYKGVKIGPFLVLNGDDQEQSQMLAWAACKITGYEKDGALKADVSSEAWLKAGFSDDKSPTGTGGPGRCSLFYTWQPKAGESWADGEGGINQRNGAAGVVIHVGGKNIMQWSGTGNIQTDFSTDNKDPQIQAKYHDAAELILNWYGTNSSAFRLVQGLITLITACVYGYALGGMAIGSIIAQIGLGVMLALLPATLIALALPSGGGEKAKFGQNPLGKKMLRLTGGFMAGKLILTMSMFFLITMIDLLHGISGGNGGGGVMGALKSALVPLGALFVLKMVLKNMGLGNITSLQGAVGLAGAAAFAASGDKNWQRGAMDAMNNSIAGRALGRADKMAKLTGTRAALGKAVGNEVSYRKKQIGNHLMRGGLDPVTGERLQDDKRGFLRGMRGSMVRHGIERDAKEAMWRKNKHKGAAQLADKMFQNQTTNQSLEDARRKLLPQTQAERDAENLKDTYGDKPGQALNKMGNRLEQAADLWQKAPDTVVGVADDGVAAAKAEKWDNAAPTYVSADAAAESHTVRRRRLQQANNQPGITAEHIQANNVVELERGLAEQRMAYQKTTDAGVTESLTDGQRRKVAVTYAEAVGADISQVVAGPLRPFVAPVTDRIVPRLSTDEATLDAARHPIHWQPTAEKERHPGESDEDYNIRQHAQLLARGWVDNAGNPIDMLVHLGYDVDKNPKDRELILKASVGQAPQLKITAEALPHGDRTAINAAMDSWKSSAGRVHTAADARRVTVEVAVNQAEKYNNAFEKDFEKLNKYVADFVTAAETGIMTDEAYKAHGDIIKLGEKIPLSSHQDAAAITLELNTLTDIVHDPGRASHTAQLAKEQEAALREAARQYQAKAMSLTSQMAKDSDVETQIDAAKELLKLVEDMKNSVSGNLQAAMRNARSAQVADDDNLKRAAATALTQVSRSADVAGGAVSAPKVTTFNGQRAYVFDTK